MWPTLPWCIRSRSSSVSRVCGTTPKNSFGALGTVIGSSVEPLLSLPQPAMPRPRQPAAASAARVAFIRGKASYRR